MNLFERMKLKSKLQDCNYQLAAQVLINQFKDAVIKQELAKLLDIFLEKPCFDNALSIIEFDPKFIVFFEGSKPGGFFSRNLTQ